MKVVIIEDEKLSAEHLANLLKRVDASIQVMGYLDTVKSVVKAFQDRLVVDLIFLDIHLADGISFEIFKQVHIETPIIFTTAYDDYAIQAFKLNSIDYLLKPVAINDLQIALDKFKKQHQVLSLSLLDNITQAYQQASKPSKSRFMVKLGQTIDSIRTEDILHFYTQESITFLVNKEGKRFPVDYTLEDLEDLLSNKFFFRINRKVILNIAAIQKVSTHINSRLHIASQHLHDDNAIVSRERVADFKSWLDS